MARKLTLVPRNVFPYLLQRLSPCPLCPKIQLQEPEGDRRHSTLPCPAVPLLDPQLRVLGLPPKQIVCTLLCLRACCWWNRDQDKSLFYIFIKLMLPE